ncbi:unnamed protein product [Caenorhabditis bovis]|uniref:SANT domain-containing protein n=1 Tax=Caenorhabditis bovis TaxID=2654633 RepID=A0A8S1EPN3_9PELO|nr:unnamed protein product [Caenorhabditis bovis]
MDPVDENEEFEKPEDETVEDETVNEDEQSDEQSSNEFEEATVVEPRRSNRQPKKKKRNSSDSGGEEEPSSASGHNVVPLSNVDNLIHIGSEYQAAIDDFTSTEDIVLCTEDPDRDELVWRTPSIVDEKKLEMYVNEAVGRFRLPIDRALYILMKTHYNYEAAGGEASKRRQIRDRWTEEERAIFTNAFHEHGKKFAEIRSALPHRSMASIIQYYYDTKKNANYKTSLEVKLSELDGIDEDEISDEDDNEDDDREIMFYRGTCENCGERTEKLSYNTLVQRKECQPCLQYMRLMGAPRPVSLRDTTKELKRVHIRCPERMRKHVERYEELSAPATGDPTTRLKIGRKKAVKEEDDCMILEAASARRPSSPLIVEPSVLDGLVDQDTCRMTRTFSSEEDIKEIERLKDRNSLPIMLVWRKKQTICMEDIEILGEEARRKMYEAAQCFARVNRQDVANWKQEMQILKSRVERKSASMEGDLKSQRNRQHNFQWTDQEKQDAIRCFHWYQDDFDAVAEILGNKTAPQIRQFYNELGEDILESIKKYQDEMREKIVQNNIMAQLNQTPAKNNHRFDPTKYIHLD